MRFVTWLLKLLGGAVSPPPPPPPAGDWAARLLALHNARRPGHPLQVHPGLSASAQAWAAECARRGSITHGDWLPRLQKAAPELREWSENIAQGQRSPEECVADWMSDPPHARNLTDPTHRFVGFGLAGDVWVADYGG